MEIFQDLNALKGKFEACNKELSGLVTSMRRVEEENKGIETEMKQSQKELTEMRNNFLLLQHEAKEEAKGNLEITFTIVRTLQLAENLVLFVQTG